MSSCNSSKTVGSRYQGYGWPWGFCTQLFYDMSRTLGNDCPQFGKLALHRLRTMEEIHGLPVEYSVLQCSLV